MTDDLHDRIAAAAEKHALSGDRLDDDPKRGTEIRRVLFGEFDEDELGAMLDDAVDHDIIYVFQEEKEDGLAHDVAVLLAADEYKRLGGGS